MAALVELGDTRELDELNKQLADAKVSDERYGSDGSVELTLSLSTEELPLKRGTRSEGERIEGYRSRSVIGRQSSSAPSFTQR